MIGVSVFRESVLVAALLAPMAAVCASKQLPPFNANTPYLIYYGNWDSNKVEFARNHYRLVILHPGSNVRRPDIAALQRGPDNISGTPDDVMVLGYLSVAEDDRPGAPFAGDGSGPRIDPRPYDTTQLSSITNAIGLPSPGGTGYASYYLDTKASPDGKPDRNAIYGGCYVNAGDPAWWETLRNMTIASDQSAGLQELLTTNTGKGFGCDGVFLDTLDTAAPNSFGGTTYEWTAPGMQRLIERIYTNYPGKWFMGNRGLFFYNPQLKTYAYTLRPYLHMLLFESYFTDSSNSGQISASFPDNKFNYAPKLNAEAARPDGFIIFALDYNHTVPLEPAVIARDYRECMGEQGWPLYRTNPQLDEPFNTEAASWLLAHPDDSPPVWDSTAAQDATPPSPRVGLRQVVAESRGVTARWDVARDQTGPVRYNLYYTAATNLDFASCRRITDIEPALPLTYSRAGTVNTYPFEYRLQGLVDGRRYLFAIRAHDSASPPHEETNSVILSAIAGRSGQVGTFRRIAIDGHFADWTNVPVLYQGDTNSPIARISAVSFANDDNYLYGHITLSAPAAPFASLHLFVDADKNNNTGFHPGNTTFGAEVTIQAGVATDTREDLGTGFPLTDLNWAAAPEGTNAEFEFRVSLDSRFPDGSKVFTDYFGLLIQYAGQSTRVGGISYPRVGTQFEDWQKWSFSAAELKDANVSGETADASGDDIPNLLKYAFNLDPHLQHSRLAPLTEFVSTGGSNYLAIQYTGWNSAADLQYLGQFSNDLRNWAALPPNQRSQVHDNEDGTSLFQWLVPLDTGFSSRFVRIAVEH